MANGRYITILDKEVYVFGRICNIFEIYLVLVGSRKAEEEESNEGLWSVYTTHTHIYKEPDNNDEEERKAVRFVFRGSTSDLGIFERITTRERSFPYELIKKALSAQVECAEASSNDDRIHILNTIVGKSIENINDVPYILHDAYVEFNDSFRGYFASSAAALQRVAKKDDAKWNRIINNLSRGAVRGLMVFDFKSDGMFDGLTAARATQLVAHLPLTIDGLHIWNAEYYGFEFWDALIERVKQFYSIKDLTIEKTLVDGEEGGQKIGLQLAKMLSSNTTIERVNLWNTDLIGTENVEQWGDALMENNIMTELNLKGMGDDWGGS